VACTTDQDTHCAPCDTLPMGRALVQPGDCARTRCVDGWGQISVIKKEEDQKGAEEGQVGDNCALCRAGWVCRNDTQTLCPGNNNSCTATIGASHPLQCAGGPIEDVVFQYTLLASDGRTPLIKASYAFDDVALDALVQRWLLYGVYQGCTRTVLGITGTLTCVVSVPQCVRAPFREWLLAQLPIQQPAIASTQGAVLMSSPRVRIRAAPKLRHNSNNNGASLRPSNAPELIIRPRAWGQSHLQPLFTLGACAATLSGLTIGTVTACALAYLRYRRRSDWARVEEAHRLRA
jgi:hypothetical protein